MIWLDSAATSFQKPPEVKEAVLSAMERMSTPGRGAYPAAALAAETALRCREEIAELFYLDNPERVIFTMNATHALNIAIKSLTPPGGRAVISGYEHNAVTRPLKALGARIFVADAPLFQEAAAIAAFEKLITPDIDVVICNHVSNVFGFIQPIEAIAALCNKTGKPLIIDASQSAGMIDINIKKLNPAFIAMPGHKGLYGPQGTGVLLCGDINNNINIRTLIEGGTGSQSLSQDMPEFLPDRLESGTHNMPGIAGLLEGVKYVRKRSPAAICGTERRLALMASDALREMSDVQVFSLTGLRDQTGVVSFRVAGMDTEEIGDALAEQGIAVRAGLHCAPLAHKTAGTLDTGTVRISFSAFNTPEEVLKFLAALKLILKNHEKF